MIRNLMIVGFVAMFFVAMGGPGLTASAQAAEMVQMDMIMIQQTGDNLQALQQEINELHAELQRIMVRLEGSKMKMGKAVSAYCKSIPQSLKASQFSPSVCQ